VFFIPRFQQIFRGFNATLPLLTQLIIDASDAVRSYGLFIALALALGGYSLRSWFKSARGRRAWEEFVLRVPQIGPVLAEFAMARFCRMLGTLLAAGVCHYHRHDFASMLRDANAAAEFLDSAATTCGSRPRS
jgi:type II secretory pathway component PulF